MRSSKPNMICGTGRRKTASARVMLSVGSGKRTICSSQSVVRQDWPSYFNSAEADKKILEPLRVLGQEENFDVHIVVRGGGISGQIEAARLGVARALVEYDEGALSAETGEQKPLAVAEVSGKVEVSWRRLLRKANLLTRDAREVERKKVGLRKARKRKQFSKR